MFFSSRRQTKNILYEYESIKKFDVPEYVCPYTLPYVSKFDVSKFNILSNQNLNEAKSSERTKTTEVLSEETCVSS